MSSAVEELETEKLYPVGTNQPSANHFCERFPTIIKHLISLGLSIYLENDTVIPAKSEQESFTTEQEHTLMKQLYYLHKAKARIKFDMDVWQTYSYRYLPALYRALKVRMPIPKISDYGITSQLAIDTIATYAKENPTYTEKELFPNDQDVINQITRDFGTTFEHYSIPHTISRNHGSDLSQTGMQARTIR